MAETDGRSERVPDKLRDLIAQDLEPVRPLRNPWMRAAALFPAALIVLVGIPWVLGLRADAGSLGAALSWGISAFQMVAGIVLVGLALRESVPGHALSARVIGSSIGAGIAIVLATTVTTFAVSPSVAPESLREFFFEYCFRYSALAGVPLLLIAGLLAARALPLRPWVAGALYGLGAGLMADAGWRLFCDVSAPQHVLSAHGGAVLTTMLLGVVAAEAVERVRWWLGGR